MIEHINMFDALISQYHYYADKVPLELFTFVGAFVEEVIAPIPSPLVLTLAGTVAASQDKSLLFLGWIAVIGAVGKTLGGYLLYVVTDRAEDLIFSRFGKYLGITHKEIEKMGSYFNNGNRDALMLFLARSIPIVPSAPISILCGFIKFNLRSFILWTFIGSIFRNAIFLYFGYFGLASTDAIVHGFDKMESIIQLFIAATLLILIVWMYKKRSTGNDPLSFLKRFFKK
jgi:membrane protein DedA with SNARE-associated domain